ncbi:helix-turn-helix transcriptional regulator [Paraburkholderia sp.]|uniref:AraC family transcriptional regulator n=1 Tax=Paraburkholderia sp. TaxID=1926495 RepID=UPI00238A9C98|nr:helix-turn-helix transcriptional regulator [Paraburkholderia sp.]MDE1181620.1 helix-turn-helix transcriptional regulator [Paraburkholderia sp.]
MTTPFDPNADSRPVFVVAGRHTSLDETAHSARHVRLIYAREGVLTVCNETGRWVAPPGYAVWVLPGLAYRLVASGPVAWQSLYLDPEKMEGAVCASVLPAQACVVKVDRLVDALLEAATDPSPGSGAAHPMDDGSNEPDDAHARLMQVLLDRLSTLDIAPLGLNWPRDPRSRLIADALCGDPAQQTVLDALAASAGVAARTAARLFVRETGLTFGQWRQQWRLLIALERLGRGASVAQVAAGVGYSDVSSFIAVFREAMRETPARFFR